ncbi:MAG: IS110 family transposase [bacterium]|nr:IS110 family transposase [bacterium]
MNQLIKYVTGIDIAKDKFDACLMSMDVQLSYKVIATHQFSNTPAGFKELLKWQRKHCKEKIVMQTLMEASGVYHEKLAIYLTEAGKVVFVVLPNKARKYMEALGLKSKNDSIDAQGLALMCAQHKFEVWQPIAKFYYELRLLTRHNQSILEAKTMFCNQKHALGHSGYSSKPVMKQIEKTIGLFDKQIKENRGLIKQHLESNEEVKRKVNQICHIKGVDVLTVATILAETNGFALFKKAGQLVSYAGYDVVENQSGKHTGRTKISKKGNSRIRRILHMPAFNVVRFKQRPFINLHERVYDKSKIKMKAYVAVQKKLLVLIYSLWKKDEAYQPGYVSNKTSGNEEPKVLFPLNHQKEVVPPKGSTTQDELRYNESPEALFPFHKHKNIYSK